MKHRSVLLQHLNNFCAFSIAEEDEINAMAARNVRTLAARRDLVRQGEVPHVVYLITAGWGFRYKTLEDGRRQIIGVLLPGDLCDLNNFILHRMDHSIGALSAISYVEVPHDHVDRLCAAYPRIGRAFWWQLLTTMSIQREWLLNIGQRNAMERIGHLLCEIFLRSRAVGLSSGTACEMPLTQTDIAEAVGLTPVHVNRMLQDLRAAGLVGLTGRILDIPDLAVLRRFSLFDDLYLHLQADAEHAPTGGADADM